MKQIILGLLLASFFIFIGCNKKADNSEEQEYAEPRPKVEVSEEEQQTYLRKKERFSERFLNANMRMLSQPEGKSSFANGQISGTWENVRFTTGGQYGKGYRCTGSAYDPVKDVIYIVSYAGHLWKIDRDEENPSNTRWIELNSKDDFNGFLISLNYGESEAFRLIRAEDNEIQYSNDEGHTWLASTGLSLSQNVSEGAVQQLADGQRVIVVGQENVYESDDDGLIYSALDFALPAGKNVVVKPHHSEDLYLISRPNDGSTIATYRMTPDEDTFHLQYTVQQSTSGIKRAFGTLIDNTFHMYLAHSSNVYYSPDGGETWKVMNSDNTGTGDVVPREVHPDMPNVVFRGYLDVGISTDNGGNFSNTRHRLGWDVQHIEAYKRTDGSYFVLVGNDFGSFISYTPEDIDSFIQLNNDSPIQMAYDYDESQNFGVYFTALQDRGTRQMRDNGSVMTGTSEIRSTDGLRVTRTNNGKGVWTWMYFGSMYHKSLIGGGNTQNINFTGNWWASAVVPSPNPEEDAVYAAYGDHLTKFTYDPFNQQIFMTDHYFNFNKLTNQDLGGFGYSQVNTDRWYVSLKNGDLFYSEDGGDTFEESELPSSKPRANDQNFNYTRNQQVIKTSPTDELKVCYAGVGNVFLISEDGGKTFSNHNNGLDVYRFRDFEVTPDEKFIYAACANAGIWVFSIEEDKWYELNDEHVPDVDFTGVEYITRKNRVRFSTYGNGILNFNLDETVNLDHPANLMASLTSEGIALTWEDSNADETGFVIERSSNGVNFEKIGTTRADEIGFLDKEVPAYGEVFYRIFAIKNEEISAPSLYAVYQIPLVKLPPKDSWTLVSVSNEDPPNDHGATNAFDGNINTIWMTEWNVDPVPSHPHEIVIDMNETINAKAFGYYPRQDNPNGRIGQYELYTTSAINSWGDPVATGTFLDNGEEQIVELSGDPIRYFKLISLSSANDTYRANTKHFGGAAELTMYEEIPTDQVKAPLPPQILQAGFVESKFNIEVLWLDASTDELGYELQRVLEDNSIESVETFGENITKATIPVDPSQEYELRVRAFNAAGENFSSAVKVTSRTNTAPVINMEDTYEIQSSELVDISINGFDADGDQISYSLEDAPDWLAISNDRITGVPSESFSGDVTFSLIASDGWTGSDRLNITISVELPPLSIPVEELVEVFPNPVIDRLTIVLSENGEDAYLTSITDLAGRLISRPKITNKTIDVSSLKEGIYILELTTNQQKFRTRIIKK